MPWLRTGTRPSPDPETWTYWVPLDKAYRPDATERRNRWAQLKFDLITERPQSTPRLPDQFDWSFDLRRDPPAQKDRFVVESSPRARQPQITSVSFVYEEPSARLKLLRERYQLDKVIAPGRTEMERLMLLRHWVRNQWHTAWVNHPSSWMPPWDALRILEARDQPDCLTNCTHYAAVFTQCCLALGWNARHCILDLHCVTEVYVNQHDKWVMMDAGNSSVRADVGSALRKARGTAERSRVARRSAGWKDRRYLGRLHPGPIDGEDRRLLPAGSRRQDTVAAAPRRDSIGEPIQVQCQF